MKNILRRSFTLLLCLALCLSLLPAASVYAEEEPESAAPAEAEGEPVTESELPPESELPAENELPVESEPITESELQAVIGKDPITSFEDLEALCSNPPESVDSYPCFGTIVIERDLTVPETVQLDGELSGNCTLVVPEGVTLTNNGWIFCNAEINGTFVNNLVFDAEDQVNITGRVVNNGSMSLPYDSTEGLDKIEEADNSWLELTFDIADEGRLRTVLQSAEEDAAPTHGYLINIKHAISLSADLVAGENTALYLYAPVDIPTGITLVNNRLMCVHNTMTVNGSLVNNGYVDISKDYNNKYTYLLALGETGTYSGYGEINIEKGYITDPFMALPGFDSYSFEQEEDEYSWTLYLPQEIEILPDITSFEELEALCNNPPDGWSHVFYSCGGTIVIERDLTIPETVYLNGIANGCTLVVPEGVTLTNNGWIFCIAAEINGTFVNNDYFQANDQVNITGWVVNNGEMYLPYDSTEGLDKIEEADNSWLELTFDIADEGRLRTVLQSAEEDAAPTHGYLINIKHAISLSADLVAGENTALYLYAPVDIPAGITLVNNKHMCVHNTVTVNGSLVNNGGVYIYNINNDTGLLALGETGTYSGYGEILIQKGYISDPFMALPGFDSYSFEQEEYEDYWSLYLPFLPHITSFEELEALCSNPPEENKFYSCAGTIVIERDLTIPETVSLTTDPADGGTLVVPEGVILTNNSEWICCIAAEINGTLVNNGVFDVESQVNITGRVVNNRDGCMILPGNSVEGLEKIEEADFSILNFQFFIEGEDRLRAALQSAAEDAAPTHFYNIVIIDALSLSADLVAGKNTSLSLGAPVDIPVGKTLVNNGFVGIYHNTMTVNGSLVNNGYVDISIDYNSGNTCLLALGETGTYSGYGEIRIEKGYISDPFMALSGFDSYSFEQQEYEYYWTLCLRQDIRPGDITGDGDVDTKDAIALMQYLTGDNSAVSGSADVNGDGEENTKDVVLLMRYLTGEDVIIY